MSESLALLAALPASAHTSLAFILGLLTGSFLNVVIFRMPLRMQYEWTAQYHEWLNKTEYPEPAPAGLVFPASHCMSCKTALKPWHNIPVISFLILRARCATCKTPISWRYPLVELLTAILSAVVIHHFGLSWQGGAVLLLTWALIALSFIDLDHQLLPDDIVLPMMWMGLGLSLVPLFASPSDAIFGTIFGYLAFWSVFHIFKILTGKQGMGHGDFKLMAVFGAWIGWQYLPQIILISTLLGSIVGISLMLFKKARGEMAIPFGPYIAIAGWCAILWGAEINEAYFRFAGL
ncbi:MAG TPA: prepilin peptidase [Gammaproteobacteria bacterium]|jgi:leader peptidase (prepilin peptidase)/N-methyltransferase|nr:prepilin peptidase [Gammaproteobacteria bacterium]